MSVVLPAISRGGSRGDISDAAKRQSHPDSPPRKRRGRKKKAKAVSFGGLDSDGAADREPERERMDVREIVRRISAALPSIVSVRVDGAPRGDWLPRAAGGDAAGGGSRSESEKKEEYPPGEY